ncbi:MAG: ATP-dependent Clp protease proteolytic subunit [candidate division KSB1 bacterium]|nr:ATP-dependent Clp protease proteolytic subunit [candidate division KSB1 bacterium]MDZ7335560.1 ATP-dependent Clp protease proteolytic subunit [candidate division KSB1 bacterium]MDZ7356432.1 ATP-dependent Clp protease proteolytic subunit [candidate division KSB1 bacterium]MDZ7375158.1 ATP-dependent Clp protease proteolytic subunit [candidate division KSB1 bacterium]MDZ7401203.1 ATP-dependent Clp protease proteolytic subunit [candidate division KSB1 bacterium]
MNIFFTKAFLIYLGALVSVILSIGGGSAQSLERVDRDSAASYYVKIEGEINLGVPNYLSRVIQQANRERAGAVILEINTPGGRVDAALEIRDAIFGAEVPVVAFINHEAASAGALISLSCDSIYMSPGSSIGAVTPVDMQGQKASEKMVSYLRSVMRSIAQRNHRPVDLAEAMVDEDVSIPGVIEKGKLLTLTAEEAVRLRMADAVLEDLDGVLERLQLSTERMIRTRITWSEKLVYWLTNPIISSLLLTLGILGLIFEVRTPGWGIGGTLSLLALALFFGSHYLVNLAQWTEILIFLAGLVLILLEIFVIPGFGLPGILGIALILASFVLSLLPKLEGIGFEEILNSITKVGISFIAAFILIIPIIQLVPKSRAFQKLILDTSEKSAEGYRSSPAYYEQFLGAEGTAVSPLRPVGIGLFNGQRLNVVAEGDFIEPNQKIKIIKVEGNRVIVRKIS